MEGAKMKILLCTPVYNGGNTLFTLYESVLNSSRNLSVKVLWTIVNANSTDNTTELAEKFIIGNPLDNLSIVHIREDDNGMYDAIRKVFDRYVAKCDWMGWINCDDYLAPNCFHDLKAVAKISGINFVVGCRSVKLESGELITCSQEISTTSVSCGLHDGFLGPHVQQEGIFFNSDLWNDLEHKDTFAACKLAGDWFLWMNLAKAAEIYENIRPMAVFCKHSGQLSENIEAYNDEIDSILPKVKRYKYRAEGQPLESKKFIVKGERVYFVNHPIALKK
jgi:glycosyltransferase involved in cell wall biosynthesis